MQGQNPILRTSSYDFLVKDISYSKFSFSVANIAAYEDNCPVPLYSYSFDQTPFTCSSENLNLSFFNNCTTEPIDYPTYEVGCAKNASHYSFAVFHKNYSLNECQFMVNAPFHTNDAVNFTGLLRMNYIEILKKGFLLNWTTTDFQYYKKRGGRCGFDGNQFLCFSKDKPYLKNCGSGNNKFQNIVIIFLLFILIYVILLFLSCFISPISVCWVEMQILFYSATSEYASQRSIPELWLFFYDSQLKYLHTQFIYVFGLHKCV